jgi:hypothetical protein
MKNKALLMILMAVSTPVFGKESTAAFLKLPSPRAYALGRANATMSFGAQALGANPANLGRGSGKREISSSFISLMDGEEYASLGFALQLPGKGNAIGLNVVRLGASGFDRRDEAGAKIGTYSAQDLAASIGFSRTLFPRFQAGMAVRAVRSEIASYKSNTALCGDAGLTYTGKKFALGVAGTNFGSKLKLGKEADNLPAAVNAGIRGRLGPVTAVLEGSHLMNEGETSVSLGMEYGLGPISLRAGYGAEGSGSNLALKSQDSTTKLLNGFTAGFGLKMGRFGLDYALGQQAVEWGLTHTVAVTFGW